ncbi:MAG: AsmA family protein [Bacteroidota bacterium]
MRLSAALKLLAVLVAALAVGLVAAAKSMDFQRIKAVLSEQVQAATGRPLAIAGPLELRLGLIPKVIATGVTLGNAAGASRPDMVRIERVEAEVALLPLLKREIRILRLVVSAPDILLETDRAGVGNWSFPAAQAQAAAAAPPSVAPAGGVPATRFSLREVKIKNGRIAYRDGRAGSVRTFNIHKLTVLPDANAAGTLAVQLVADLDGRMMNVGGAVGMAAGKPLGVHLQGGFDGVQAKVEGSVADPLAARGIDLAVVMQGDEMGKVVRLAGNGGTDAPPALGPFKLSGRLADSHGPLALTDLDVSAGRRDALVVTARGGVRDLVGLSGIELALAVDSDTLAGLSRLTGAEVPPIGPLKLTGTLGGDARRLKLTDLKASLAGSDASGELALDLSGHPRLTGTLSSTTLALADFTTPASKPGEKLAAKGLKAAGDGRLFPAEPLNMAPLRALDAQVSLRAAKMDLGGVRLSDASADLSVTGGRLALRPFKAWAAGGAVEAEAVLDASGRVPALALRAQGRGVDLGRLLKDAGLDVLAGGHTDSRLDLHGQGESWRALMASLSGEVVVSIGDGKLRNTALDWAGGDVLVQLAGVLNPLSRSEDTTPLSCAVARFTVKDGLATADRGIAVETAKVNVVGAGTVNLRDEHLDLGITPRARDGIGLSLTAPLAGMTRVRGTLASPALALDELGTARSAASVGAAVFTSGLSLVGEALFDRITADSTPCRTALGSAPTVKPAAKMPEKKARKGR